MISAEPVPPPPASAAALDPSARGRIGREAIGGLTTFLTMSYIIVVNPSILASEGTGIPFSGALTATVLLCVVLTIAMGLYARLPFAVAPGMGLNAFFAYQVILRDHTPWPIAFGMVSWAGLAFVAVSTTRLREGIARAVPSHLRLATAAGIGLLLSFIGLRSAGLVVADRATLISAGRLGLPALLFGFGLLVTLALLARQRAFALLGGMIAATLLGLLLGEVRPPPRLVSLPDFSLFGRLDLAGAFRLAYVPAMLGIVLTDLFDSLSTFIGVAHATGLTDERGEPRNLGRALTVDAFATLLAGVFGTSAGTAYVESAAGIRAGGRGGLTAVVCGLCFLPFLFLGPLAAIVPPSATAPALVLVGVLMFRAAAALPFDRLEEAVPAFATLLLIPLTSSITQGILTGFALHAILFVLAGRRRELTGTTWALAVVAVAALGMENLRR